MVLSEDHQIFSSSASSSLLTWKPVCPPSQEVNHCLLPVLKSKHFQPQWIITDYKTASMTAPEY